MKMDIYDLEEYRLRRTENKPHNDLDDEDNAFLKAIRGDGGPIKAYIEEIAGIASIPYLQVFFELLQNAHDAGADTLYLYFVDNYFLIVNNGDRFSTFASKGKIDALWAFINKNKSSKYGNLNSIGEKGIGSKLLYSLLPTTSGNKKLSERIADELIKENNSIILYSWCKRQQYTDLIDFSNNSFSKTNNEIAPILAKFIHTYYPAMPNEKDAKGSILFKEEEVEVLRNALKSVNYREYKEGSELESSLLNSGSLLFLKLGEGVKKEILDGWQNVEEGLSIALNFFEGNSSVKRIIFNGTEISKQKLKVIHGEETTDSEDSSKYPFAIAYSIDSFDEIISKRHVEEVNLFRYAPANKEKYGLWFYINAMFSLEGNRQEVVWQDEYNKNRLGYIVKQIVYYLDSLKSNFEEYWYFYRVLLFSDLKNHIPTQTGFKDDSINYLKSTLFEYIENFVPSVSGFYDIKSNVKLNSTNLNINLSQIGIVTYQWVFLGTKHDTIVQKRFEEILGITKKNIADIILEAEEQKLNSWLKTLNDVEYLTFIEEIEKYSKEALKPKLRTLKWIKGTDGAFYSLYDNGSSAFWVLDKRMLGIFDILKSLGYPVSEKDFSNLNNLNNFITGELDNNQLLKKVIEIVDYDYNSNYTKNLTPSNKQALFHFFKNNLGKPDNIKIFSNCLYNFVSLKDLIQTTVADSCEKSLIPAKFKLAESDKHTDYEPYLVKKSEVFDELIVPFWDEWTANLGTTPPIKIKDFYDLIQYFYLEGGRKNNKLKIGNSVSAFTFNQRFEKFENCIALKYDKTKEIEVVDLLGKLGKIPIHLDFLTLMKDANFVLNNPTDLTDILLEEGLELDLGEVELILKLFVLNDYSNPFKEVYFKEDNNVFTIHKKFHDSPEQVYVTDLNLLNFIPGKSKTCVLLPSSLKNIVVNKIAIHEELYTLRKLFKEFGFEKDFALSVYNNYNLDKINNIDILKDYIGRLPNIFNLVSSNQNTRFSNNSPEVILAKLLDEYLRIFQGEKKNIKAKIYIDGTPLIELVISDSVVLREQEYSLSNLLNKYSKNAGLIGKAKKNLSAAGSLNNLLESEQLDADDVYYELLETIEEIESIVQFRFLINYQVENNDEDFDFSLIENYANSNKTDILNLLYKDDIKFDDYFQFNDWVVKQSAIAKPANILYLMTGEGIPEWVSIWINNDSNKVQFLYNCGVKDDKILTDRLFLDQKIEKESSESNELFWTLGDLDWCYRNQKKWPMKSDTDEIECLKKKIKLTADKETGLCFAIVYDSFDYLKIDSLGANAKPAILDKNNFVNDVHNLKEIAVSKIQANGMTLLSEIQGNDVIKNIEKKLSLNIIRYSLDNQIDRQSIQKSSKEWDEPQYSEEWKNTAWGKNRVLYRIFITETLIKYDYALEAPNEESISLKNVELAEVVTETSTIELENEEKDTTYVYISKPELLKKENHVERVLQVLEDYGQNPFEKDALIALLINNKNKAEGVNYSSNQSEKIPITSTIGGKKVEEGFDVTPEEQELLQLLKELGLDDEQLLRDLLNNRNKKERKKMTPNKITGLKGEKIIYEFLKYFYEPKGYKIDWSAKRGVAEFDFMVYQGEDLNDYSKVRAFIDAKTTGLEGVDSDAIPFYVAQSQLTFLKKLQGLGLSNYYLARLNLRTAEHLGSFEVEVLYNEENIPYDAIIPNELSADYFTELRKIIDFLNLSFYVLN
jgi:hypothetical protein